MDKNEMSMIGFEIVAHSGDARTHYLEALKLAENKEFDKAEDEIELANESILKAHKCQTSLLVKEAQGEELPFSVTFIHGQDHLMTTMLLKDLIHRMINLYKKI